MLTDNASYHWFTEKPLDTTLDVMTDFLDNELTDDYEITGDDDSYAIIKEKESGIAWGCHASFDGDACNHKIEFDAVGIL
ncbi:hypothetical protein [Vibrio astriarenae]|uniref:hypothetical protein n=1 Tax=Vibrio astriarenae TaxID=1481923 RepID=UPI003736D238